MILKIILIIAIGLFSIASFADVRVNGYQNNNGTNVQPYYRSNPNNTTNDNWSTQGNTNPYTGQPGTNNPNSSSGARQF